MPEYPPGTPAWVGLDTTDAAGARAFYGGLFGWTTTEPTDDGRSHQDFLLDGRMVCGMRPLLADEQGSPLWTPYVWTDDTDMAYERAVTSGGSGLVEPVDVHENGRMAVFVDNAGAPCGIWRPHAFQGADVLGEPNALGWTELVTPDLDGATALYDSVFAWAPVDDAVWEVNGEDVAGIVPSDEPPSRWVVYFVVEDVAAAAARAVQLGGAVAAEPHEREGVGRHAALTDPQGAAFSVGEG